MTRAFFRKILGKEIVEKVKDSILDINLILSPLLDFGMSEEVLKKELEEYR
jgi:hypothetical protein